MEFNYTTIEKRSISKVLFDIANIDLDIDDKEHAFMVQLMKIFSMSEDDIMISLDMSVLRSVTVIRDMSSPKKKVFSGMMLEMLKADGVITPEEHILVKAVVEAAQIPLS